MLNNWHKKEKPFLSTTSLTGGAGGFAFAGGGLYSWDGLMTLTDPGAGATGSAITAAKQLTTGGLPTNAKNDTNLFNVTPTGIRDIRISTTGTYEITATGANNAASGGSQSARFNLEENEVLRVLVGRPGNNTSQGSGGSFVVVYPESTILGDSGSLQPLYNDNNFLIAMGGDGGHASSPTSHQNAFDSDANMTREATHVGGNGSNGGGGGGGKDGSGGGGGGLKGNGGIGYGGAYGGSVGTGGDGNNYPPVASASGSSGGSGSTNNPGGDSFLSGGTGGGIGGANNHGGFGGGGSFRSWNSNGGGGGGYSGGGGGGYDGTQAGGSGGSSRVNTPSPRYVPGSASGWSSSNAGGSVTINLV